MNEDLLKKVAKKVKTPFQLMDSKWRNVESEVIAAQTIAACEKNLETHGEAFSWLKTSATTGQNQAGTNNRRGLDKLLADGSLTVSQYHGKLAPPEGTAHKDGKPLILRVTDKLLQYVDEFLDN